MTTWHWNPKYYSYDKIYYVICDYVICRSILRRECLHGEGRLCVIIRYRDIGYGGYS